MFTGEPTASRDVVALRSMNTPLPLFEPKHFVEAFVAASYKNSALRESPCIDLWCANQVQTALYDVPAGRITDVLDGLSGDAR